MDTPPRGLQPWQHWYVSDQSRIVIDVSRSFTDVVTVLLDSGANVNDVGGAHCQGVTPLIDAATNGHLDIVRLLVERGADPEITDSAVSGY